MKKNVVLHAVVMTLVMVVVAMPAFGRFSKFVCISPDSPDPRSKIQPVISFTSAKQDYLTVTVPIIDDTSRQYWLITCKEPLNEKRQNFRSIIQTVSGSDHLPRERREDVVLIAPLTVGRGATCESGDANNIRIQMSLEMARRSYIYVDYPHMVMDGGYFWTVDIPSFVERIKTGPDEEMDSNKE